MKTKPNSKDHLQPNRRRFLQNSLGAASVLGFPTIIPASALGKDGKAAPSERVAIGIIGCGNRAASTNGYSGSPEAEIAAMADPFGRRIPKLKKRLKLEDRKLAEFKDFRELLETDVDAVHITTADYWHVPNLLLAARAGKHIFVEKPLGLSIEQCLAAREVSENKKLTVQYGTQNRSTPYVRGGMELLINGHLGDVKDIYVWAPRGASGGVCNPEPVPDDLDYPLWLGPAPEAPYCHDRCMHQGGRTGIFHIYDYAIGFVAGWGAHPMDQLQWWLDETGLAMPEKVEATGTLPAEGFYNTLTHWDALFRYPGGREIRFTDNESIAKHLPELEGFKNRGHGTLFVGTEGWVCMDRGSIQGSSRELLQKIKDPGERRVTHPGKGHMPNFIDAVLGKNDAITSLDSAIKSDIACHLVDLAVRHGSPLEWDQSKMTITNNEAARKAMHRPMRDPWNVLDPKFI
jgi:predicted dehydrogenase